MAFPAFSASPFPPLPTVLRPIRFALCEFYRFTAYRLRHLPSVLVLRPVGFNVYYYLAPRRFTIYQFTFYRLLVFLTFRHSLRYSALLAYRLSFPQCPSWLFRYINPLVCQHATNPSDWETNWLKMDRPPKLMRPKPTAKRAIFGIPSRLVSRGVQFDSAALYSVS